MTVARRYPLALTMNLIQMLIVTAGIMWGLDRIGYPASAAGAVLWPLILVGVGSPGASLAADTEVGAFEQVHNSGRGLLLISLARSGADLIVAAPGTLAVIAVLYLAGWRQIPTVAFASASALAVLAALGVGLMLAGIALVYRRLGPINNIIMLAAISTVVLPTTLLPKAVAGFLGVFVPLAGPVLVFQASMNGAPANWPEWSAAILNTVLWLGLGVAGFKRYYRRARAVGTLGRY